METNTKVLLISLFVVVLALVILIFSLIKIRADNTPKPDNSGKPSAQYPSAQYLPDQYVELLYLNSRDENHMKPSAPEAEKPEKRNILEILAVDLHSFLRSSIVVIFDNVYRRLYNTKLQGFIQYEDGVLRFSKDKNSFSRVMISSDGQIIVGRNLDMCLERRMVDSSGVSDIVISTITPASQSKRWKLKNGAILDPTGNFCLGILDDKIRLFSVIFATERNLTDQLDKWVLIK